MQCLHKGAYCGWANMGRLKLGTGDPSAYVCTTLFILNHFHHLLYQWNKKQSKERIMLNSYQLCYNNVNHNGSVLWANFTLPPPTNLCVCARGAHTHTHTHTEYAKWNGNSSGSPFFLLCFQHFSRCGTQAQGAPYTCLQLGTTLLSTDSCFSQQIRNLFHLEGLNKKGLIHFLEIFWATFPPPYWTSPSLYTPAPLVSVSIFEKYST